LSASSPILALKKWAAGHAPQLRRWLHAADGRTLERLENALMRHEMQAALEERAPVALAKAISAFEAGKAPASVAWLGPAPFERTGVASFSWQCVTKSPSAIDYFCSARDEGAFLAAAARLSRESGSRLLPLSAAPLGAYVQSYPALLVQIANSSHMLAPLRAFDAIALETPNAWAEIHDLDLLNLAWLDSHGDAERFTQRLRIAYGGDRLPRGVLRPESFSALLNAGIGGLAVILADRTFRGLITHSAHAADRVRAELALAGLDVEVRTAFHPIFPAAATHRGSAVTQGLVGSFGGPGVEKRTADLIAACETLRKGGREVSLHLCGYKAKAYISTLPQRAAWLSAEEPGSAEEMERAMAGVALAAQLRARDTGESSGAIAQLLAVGAPLLATDLPAWRGDLVAARTVGPQASVSEIALALDAALDAPPTPDPKIAEARSVGRYWDVLADLLSPKAGAFCSARGG
jgi:hypothetical protein